MISDKLPSHFSFRSTRLEFCDYAKAVHVIHPMTLCCGGSLREVLEALWAFKTCSGRAF